MESVPAEFLGGSEWRLLGTPSLALGCAEGDMVTVTHDGEYEVSQRGGNLSVLFYGSNLETVFAALGSAFRAIRGKVEAPPDRRFIVATVPVSVGFETVETAIREGLAGDEVSEWFYGNVYDEHDRPLNWWLPQPSSD